MASGLKTEDIPKDKGTNDPMSIHTLTLNHKALSHVSCLTAFNNLQLLDLKFNALTSLKGVESCFALKSLFVQHNKLESLKGIEGLTNLLVLNAGNNKLRSMDEVKTLLKLRALILNDNEIASISGLDNMLELNSLILSRNPIHKVGSSLVKLRSVTQISLSYCQLEDIDKSIKVCIGLRQLRLAHNDIKTLPMELALIKKLEILDLGYNMISRWSDLEVLSSLHNLRSLNLCGNPISEKVKFIRKVKKFLPSLQTLNSKKMNKDETIKDAPVNLGDEFKLSKEKKQHHDAKHVNQLNLNNDCKLAMDIGLGADEPIKSNASDCNDNKICEKGKPLGKKTFHTQNITSRKVITCQVSEVETDVALNDDGKNEPKKQKKKVNNMENLEQEAKNGQKKQKKHIENAIKHRGNKRKIEKAPVDVIDDTETSFMNLLSCDSADNVKLNDEQNGESRAVTIFDEANALVIYPAKKKKRKIQGARDTLCWFPTPEIGLGGPSAWTDD